MKFLNQKLNTITKRYFAVLVIFFIVVVLILNLFLPNLYYYIMKPYFIKNVSTLIDSSMVRQSVVWTNNRLVYCLVKDEQFHSLINKYYNSNKDDNIIIETMDYIMKKRASVVFNWNKSITAKCHNFVIMDDGTVFCNDEGKMVAEYVRDDKWFKERKNEEMYSPLINLDNGEQYICFARSGTVGSMNFTIVCASNFLDIKKQYNEIEELGINDYMMLQGDRVIYQNLTNSNINLKTYPDYMYSEIQYQPMQFDSENGLDFMVLCSLPFENFRIAVNISKDTLLMTYSDLFTVMKSLIYFLLFLIMLITYLIINRILHRLVALDNAMKEIKIGNEPLPIYDDGNDEIARLTNSFEIMLNEIKLSTNKMLVHEKREQQMQYALLVSALDPHYIYNTLNTITFLAHMNRTEDIIKVNNALIATLKDRLRVKECKTFDSVKVEIEVLKQYLVIQNYLFSNKIDLVFNIEDDDLMLEIPKNILQPLVENSIKHGILPNKDIDNKPIPGQIYITINQEKEQIIIEIKDNGIGFKDDILLEYQNLANDPDVNIFDMEHIGIKNIYMRLRYLYGQDFSFIINSNVKKGTQFIIKLPIQRSIKVL